ncbi:MAG: SRPBCC domain-containing protein [Bacteroidota bacterium]
MTKENNFSTEKSIEINSTPEILWEVLTNPEKIKLFMFGSEIVTSWKPGSPVTFTRVTHGQQWQDKGKILKCMPGELLKFSYWSSQEGYEDIPQNYSIITYTLIKQNPEAIKLTYRRENIPIRFELKNQEKHLPELLEKIKKLAEQF